MKKLLLLPTIFALAGATACGDDTTMADTGATDSGTDTSSPPVVCPFSGEQMGGCCYRTSNAGNLDSPDLRISGVELSTPLSLSTIIVTTLLVSALDDDLFNWLLQVEITGTDASITTGYGVKNADSTFSFTTGTAPAPGSPDRWDPVTVAGSIAGETVSAPSLNDTFTVPVLNADGSAVTLELPLRNMTLEMATLSEERSCIGGIIPGGRWNTAMGSLNAFITVEDADAGLLQVPDAGIDTTLCMFIANIQPRPAGQTCAGGGVAQAEWPIQPDALCDAAGCAQDSGDGTVCDPASTCNAWFLEAAFSAQGVTITP